jgi:type II secretory pathway component PulJ
MLGGEEMRRSIKKIKCRLANSDGFTLLDAMIGVLVFSVGILAIAALQTNSVKSNTLAEDVQINTVMAMDQIEELMATDFLDQRVNGDGTTCGAANDPRYTICVQRLDNLAIPGAKKVVVTSQFTSTVGKTQTVTLKIFKPRIN